MIKNLKFINDIEVNQEEKVNNVSPKITPGIAYPDIEKLLSMFSVLFPENLLLILAIKATKVKKTEETKTKYSVLIFKVIISKFSK